MVSAQTYAAVGTHGDRILGLAGLGMLKALHGKHLLSQIVFRFTQVAKNLFSPNCESLPSVRLPEAGGGPLGVATLRVKGRVNQVWSYLNDTHNRCICPYIGLRISLRQD
jgi:hypothetical protein